MNAKMISDALHTKYPEPTVTAIYPCLGGYLVVAPNTDDLIDFNDPFYKISDDLSKVDRIGVLNLEQTLKIMKKKPLWTRKTT